LPPLACFFAGIRFGKSAIIIAFSTAPFKRLEKSPPINGFGLGLLQREAKYKVALAASLR